MALDLTKAGPVFLGVPVAGTEHADTWVAANCSHGPAARASNMLNRFLGRQSVFRAGAGTTRRIAFGWWSPGGSFALPTVLDGYALVRTAFSQSATVRLRHIATGPYWIEQWCPTFAGAPSGYLPMNSVAYGRANALTGNLSIGCWIYPQWFDATPRAMVSTREGGATRYPFSLCTVSGAVNPKLRFLYTHSSGTAHSVDSPESALLALNTWANVWITISGTTLTWYINGSSIGTSTLGAATRDAGNGTASIARDNATGYFLGALSDLRIFDGVEAPSTTKIHYLEESANRKTSKLVLWFPLWNGSTADPEYSHGYPDDSLIDATAAAATYSGTVGVGTFTRLGTGATITDLGTVTPFSGTLDSATFALRERDIWHLLASSHSSGGAFQIDIADAGKSGATAVSHLVAGPAVQFTDELSFPFGVVPEDLSTVMRLPSGQLHAYARDALRTQNIAFDAIDAPAALVTAFEKLLRTKKTTEEFFWVHDPSARTYAEELDMLARFSAMQEVRSSEGLLWGYNATLEEIGG